MDNTDNNERTPLVGEPLPYKDPSEGASNLTEFTWRRNVWYIIILVLMTIASSLAGPPYVRLLESVVCKNYYLENNPRVIGQDGSVPEDYCKENSIQQSVALIQSIQQAFNFGAGLLASFHTSLMLRGQGTGFKLQFCGRKFERRSAGRRFVLTLNLIALLCTLTLKYSILYSEPKAVEATWVSSVFLLLAGGIEWRSEIIFMMIGDATSRDENFQNTYIAIAFQQAAAGLAGWGSIQLAVWLMSSYGVWVPLNIGLGTLVFVLFLVQFMAVKEPFHHRENSSSESQSIIGSFKETLKFFFGFATSSVWLLISTYLVSSTFPQLVDGSLWEQYISTRFKKHIADAAVLQAWSTCGNSVVLFLSVFLLGKLNGSHFAEYWRWIGRIANITPVKDIYISQVTAISQSVGFVIIGLSASYPGVIAGLVFCALGQPFRIATRCALLYMVHIPGEDTITRLFSVITLVDMVSGTGVNFLLTCVFNQSLKLEGFMVGLPFFFAALLLAVVAVVVAVAAFSINGITFQTMESSNSSTLGENRPTASTT